MPLKPKRSEYLRFLFFKPVIFVMKRFSNKYWWRTDEDCSTFRTLSIFFHLWLQVLKVTALFCLTRSSLYKGVESSIILLSTQHYSSWKLFHYHTPGFEQNSILLNFFQYCSIQSIFSTLVKDQTKVLGPHHPTRRNGCSLFPLRILSTIRSTKISYNLKQLSVKFFIELVCRYFRKAFFCFEKISIDHHLSSFICHFPWYANRCNILGTSLWSIEHSDFRL